MFARMECGLFIAFVLATYFLAFSFHGGERNDPGYSTTSSIPAAFSNPQVQTQTRDAWKADVDAATSHVPGAGPHSSNVCECGKGSLGQRSSTNNNTQFDDLIMIPKRTAHAPHWLEELASYCNILSLLPGRHAKAVLIQQKLPIMSRIFRGQDSAAVLSSKPLKSVHAEWSEGVSGILTGILMQQTADLVLWKDRSVLKGVNVSGSQRRLVPVRLSSSAIEFKKRYVGDKDGHPHTGKQWFASQESCSIFRNAIRPLWSPAGPDDQGAQPGPRPPSHICITNRPPGSRNRWIRNAKALAGTLRDAFPGANVSTSVPSSADSLSEQLGHFASCDVVIAPHGEGLYAVPAMQRGSLLVEVFRRTMQGTCLSFFWELARRCGVAHRVVHAGTGNQVKLREQGGIGCYPSDGSGAEVDAETVVAFIADWAAGKEPKEEELVDDPDLLHDMQKSPPDCNRVCSPRL